MSCSINMAYTSQRASWDWCCSKTQVAKAHRLLSKAVANSDLAPGISQMSTEQQRWADYGKGWASIIQPAANGQDRWHHTTNSEANTSWKYGVSQSGPRGKTFDSYWYSLRLVSFFQRPAVGRLLIIHELSQDNWKWNHKISTEKQKCRKLLLKIAKFLEHMQYGSHMVWERGQT